MSPGPREIVLSLGALLLLPLAGFAQDLPPEEIGAHFEATVVESGFGTTTVNPFGLRGEIYDIHPGTATLPKFEKLKSVGVIYTNGLNIPVRDFTEGFPGVTDRIEWFAIDYKGRFYVARPGKYHFALASDDGSKLYIDGRLVINNDGVHAIFRKDGSVNLAGGFHTIRLSYFQGPRFSIALLLGVSGPGEKQLRFFNTDEFKPPANPDDWKYGRPEHLNKPAASKPGNK